MRHGTAMAQSAQIGVVAAACHYAPAKFYLYSPCLHGPAT